MIALEIPGFGKLGLAHLVCDYNGTLALDGHLLPGVGELLAALAPAIRIHVITADTFGLARAQLAGLPLERPAGRGGHEAGGAAARGLIDRPQLKPGRLLRPKHAP